MLIMLTLMFFQQFSGINAVLFYLTDIFIKAGTDIDPGLSATIVALVQVVACLGAVLVVEKMGRKVLLMISATLLALSMAALATFFLLDEGKTNFCNETTTMPPTDAPTTSPTLFFNSKSTFKDEDCVVIEDGYDPEMVESIGWLPLVSLMIYIFAFSIG